MLKSIAALGADTLFRYLNRSKLLVVMYHGVTENVYTPPVWTQLPVETFRSQLKFLREKYHLVTLREVTDALSSGAALPKQSALITFDDGLRNNYSVAFPVLKEMGIPATVFLTVDMIGTKEIFWFDELYLLLVAAAKKHVAFVPPHDWLNDYLHCGRIWDAYAILVESLKRVGSDARGASMATFRDVVGDDLGDLRADFGLLGWHEVEIMYTSGLVDFGVHTATHRILSELTEVELEREVSLSRRTLEAKLGSAVRTFCFPNGRPGVDFNPGHLEYLRNNGYLCAFTTRGSLFSLHHDDPMSIGRIPAGNDETSDTAFFRLSVSGAVGCLRSLLFWRK